MAPGGHFLTEGKAPVEHWALILCFYVFLIGSDRASVGAYFQN